MTAGTAPAPGQEVVAALVARGLTLGVAESLTGGLVAAAVVAVPGASQVLRGAVVAYASEVKATVLGVPKALLQRTGPVDEQVAIAMAEGVRRVVGSDTGVATTGVAGPGPSDGVPAGTVVIGVSVGAHPPLALRVHLDGDRAAVRDAATELALHTLLQCLTP